jgi:hypothetical protein
MARCFQNIYLGSSAGMALVISTCSKCRWYFPQIFADLFSSN